MSVESDRKRRKQLGEEMRSEVKSHFTDFNVNPVNTVWRDARAFVGTPDNYEITVKGNGEEICFSVELFNGNFRYVVRRNSIGIPERTEKSSFPDLSEAVAYGESFL